MTSVDVTVVVVTYNSGGDVGDCLRALGAAATRRSVQLVVVDNGSHDDSVDKAREAAPDVEVVQGHGNVGFAAACHLGAQRGQGRYLLFLNPDTEMRPGALDALVDAAERHPEAGLYGGRTLRPDGRVEASCAFGAMTPWSLTCFALGLSSAFPHHPLLDPESLGRWERDTPREVPALSGACLMVRREVWDALGGFDRTYVIYAEDADLCRRAWNAGYRPRLVPEAEVVHATGASSAPGRKQVLLHRGKATYVRRTWPAALRWYGLLCLWLGVALRGRLVPGLQPGGDSRRKTAPDAWRVAWDQRHEWLPGWEGVRHLDSGRV